MFRQVMFVLESLVAVGALVRTRICKSKLLKLTHTFVFICLFVTERLAPNKEAMPIPYARSLL